MAEKSLEEMSYGELVCLLMEKANLYMGKCWELMDNDSISVEHLGSFRTLTETYLNCTHPVREELKRRLA